MRYTLLISRRAEREYDRLPDNIQRRINRAFDEIAESPCGPGVVKLQGGEDLYRWRVGDGRIIYRVQDEALIVLVVRIGNRREVYRGL